MSDDVLHELELQAAEVFGRDGRGGRFKALEDKVEHIETKVDALDKLGVKLTAYVTAAGVGVSLLMKLIEKFL